MCPVRVFGPRVVAAASSVGLWVALACAAGCQGPDEFFRFNDAATKSGTAGSGTTGSAGTTGVAGTTGTGGSGGSPTGLGGSNTGAGGGGGANSTGAAGSGTGTAGSGNPGGRGGSTTGAGGSATGGTAGGAAGGGGSPTGAAGATGTGGGAGATSPRGGAGGGQAGSAGTTGTGGRGGNTATAGSTGAAGSGMGGGQGGSTGGAGGGGPNRIQVVALCQTATSMQEIKVTFKILNPDSVAKQWSDIKVRYYFTPTVQSAPMVTFDYAPGFPSAMITTKATPTYVEVGFAAGSGTVAAFDNVTGSKEIQLRFYNYSSTTWNSSQADDYSYKSCVGATNTAAYTDRLTMPGYYQGQLAWGSEPPL